MTALTGERIAGEEAVNGRVTAVFRRHVYEVVEELADALMWSAVGIFAAIYVPPVLDSPLPLLVLLVPLWYWTAFAVELLRWQSETFTFIEADNGTVFLIKSTGVFKRRRFESQISGLTISTSQSVIDQVIGVERIDLVGASHQFITGRRMPVGFRRLIESYRRADPKREKAMAEDGSVVGRLLALERVANFVGPDLARRKARELVEEM